MNKSFSLRAYAKKLGLSAAFLSDILKRKAQLSESKAYQVGGHLNLGQRELEHLLILVRKESQKESFLLKNVETIIKSKKRIFVKNQELEFKKLFSIWYKVPLLLLIVKKRTTNKNELATLLSIHPTDVEKAMNSFLRYKFLIPLKDGSFQLNLNGSLFQSDSFSTTLRKFHLEMMERATIAIENQQHQEKHLASETFCFDPKYMKNIKEEMDQFLSQLATKYGKNVMENNDEIYHLSMQFFKLTNTVIHKSTTTHLSN